MKKTLLISAILLCFACAPSQVSQPSTAYSSAATAGEAECPSSPDDVDYTDGIYTYASTGEPLNCTYRTKDRHGTLVGKLVFRDGRHAREDMFTHSGALHGIVLYGDDGKPASGICGDGRELKLGELQYFASNSELENCMTDQAPIRLNITADTCDYTRDDVTNYMFSDPVLSKATHEPITGTLCVYYRSSDYGYYIATYKNGIQDGIARRYNSSGILQREIPYTNGKANGIARVYDNNSILQEENTYVDGERVLQVEYKLDYWDDWETITPYENNKEHGKQVAYRRNGMLYRESDYKNGKEDGTYKLYRSNGQVLYHIMYKDGERNGITRQYYYDGTLWYEAYYKDDEVVGCAKDFDENGRQTNDCEQIGGPQ
jgi:antitoxin component YwqK of YwqJK toxin-antitoxin module